MRVVNCFVAVLLSAMTFVNVVHAAPKNYPVFSPSNLANSASVFDSSQFLEAQQLKAILEQPESTIDFAKVKLTIDKMVDPSIDIEANLKKLMP